MTKSAEQQTVYVDTIAQRDAERCSQTIDH